MTMINNIKRCIRRWVTQAKSLLLLLPARLRACPDSSVLDRQATTKQYFSKRFVDTCPHSGRLGPTFGKARTPKPVVGQSVLPRRHKCGRTRPLADPGHPKSTQRLRAAAENRAKCHKNVSRERRSPRTAHMQSAHTCAIQTRFLSCHADTISYKLWPGGPSNTHVGKTMTKLYTIRCKT